VKKLRVNIDREILLAEIPQLAERHERIAAEILKLAEKRHGANAMKRAHDDITYDDITYEVVCSRRRTADIASATGVSWCGPGRGSPEKIEDIVESKRYWIYKNLAEWRDLNATRVLREYRNGEGFLYLGRSYRLLLVADRDEPLLLKGGRFCLRRDIVDRVEVPAALVAFRITM